MKRMTTSVKSSKPKSHDDYLAAVTEDKRGALQKLRKAIRMAAPKAEECISYQGMLVANEVAGRKALRQGGGSRIEWTSSGSSGNKHRKSEILKCEKGRDQQFRLQEPENDIA